MQDGNKISGQRNIAFDSGKSQRSGVLECLNRILRPFASGSSMSE